MAQLKIGIYPDQILRKKAKPVQKVTQEERKLAYDMIETMRSYNGVGLAALQVGVSKRMIVIEDVENNKAAMVLINPAILKKKGRVSFCEGCLSIPGVHADVTRPSSVVIEAFNLDGEKIKIDAKGIFARIAQHEIDHLDGILFIDRVGFFERKKILKQIKQNVCMDL